MAHEAKPECVEAMGMFSRVIILETDMRNLKEQLVRTEHQLGVEIRDLKTALGDLRAQISGLQTRLAIIVALSAGGVTAAGKLIPWLAGG